MTRYRAFPRSSVPAALIRRLRRAAVAAALAVALGPAMAGLAAPADAQVAAAELTPAEQQALDAVEAYLDGLTTLEARFVQVGAGGGVAEGTFYLKRPGRLRIEYDDEPHLVVADGVWLTYWDAELGQRSDAPLGSTLAGFLVREDITFSGEITVTDVRLTEAGTQVDLVQTSDPGAGQLTLDFDGRPDRGEAVGLRRWVIRDAQGARTEVALLDLQRGVELANSLFRAPRPDDRRND
jgi:outer membrane lipoprotein-sorting protein